MLAWVAYLLVFCAMIGLAALSLERAIRPYGVALRWIWISALLGSLALPLALSATRHRAEMAIAPYRSLSAWVPQSAAVISSRQRVVPSKSPSGRGPSSGLELLVEALWIMSSAATAAWLMGASWYGHRRRRHWRRASVAGTELFVAEDAGPATVGLLHPNIVLPEWLLAEEPEILRMVVAHERCHAQAHDPGLLGLGFGVATLVPWNPLVWWLLHRLRLAIEVDCDRRVLLAGHDARRYARALVDVSSRRPAYVGGLAASPGSLSSIERRIILMITPRANGWRASAAAGALFSIGLATAALLILPPAVPPALAGMSAATDATGLGRFAGSYEFSSMTVLRIGKRHGQLVATYPGARPQRLTRVSGQVFRFPNVEAYIRFAADSAGRVTGLVLQQNGAATEAPRIGATRVQAIDSAISARVRTQKPMPGSQTAVRRLVAGIESGQPNYGDLSPQLAAGTRALLPKLQAELRPLGALRAIDFRGVRPNGWDQYLVRFQHGTASVGIALDSYGLVVGAGVGVQTGPTR